ncbi:MAG TPA: aldo/keto reductase [Bacillota bacterium]|nr:aldo/keto reductase [Bacillota bacterium]
MIYQVLGKSRFEVSRLCFGVLTMGPLQANFPVAKGAHLLKLAREAGVNFFDTAEYYRTYPYLKAAFSGDDRVIIATKSYAATWDEMRVSVERARKELNLDRIPIFLLHEQASAASFRGHQGAWEYLVDARSRGIVGAIGLSTHTIEAVRVASACPELDVIHPLFNKAGWGLMEGTAAEMAEAIQTAADMGKGIYAMKALAGGHLRGDAKAALWFALGTRGVASVAVGMQNEEEIRFNLAVVNGEEPSSIDAKAISEQRRKLHVESWCQGCGRCLGRCPFGALTMVGDKVQVDEGKCMVCGYCSQVCPEVALKVL